MSNGLILLAVEHKENRRLLQDYLEQYHAVRSLSSIDAFSEPFDLAIFEGAALVQLEKQVQTRKETERPLFLPTLLVSPRQDLGMITRQLWRSIDEIIFTPIEKIELLARVEVLLRTRRLSLELAETNSRLQSEIEAHKVTSRNLLASEERTRMLQSFTVALVNVTTRTEIMDLLARAIVDEVGGCQGVVGLTSQNGEYLQVFRVGSDGGPLPPSQIRLGEGEGAVIAEVMRAGQPIWIESSQASGLPTADFKVLEMLSTAASFALLPMSVGSKTIGVLGLGFAEIRTFSDEDRAFFQLLAQECAQAFERVRFYEVERERGAAEERQRLARDLHDSVSQNLYSINMIGQSLPRMLNQNAPRAHEMVQDLTMLSKAALSEMRTLLLELRPASLVRSSLNELINQLVTSLTGRRQIEFSCTVELERRLPDDVHITFYRIVQESLNNIVKHSEATKAEIWLYEERGQVILRIRDNGRGFDITTKVAGLGLGGMRERAALVGAVFEMISDVGKGTEVIVSWTDNAQ